MKCLGILMRSSSSEKCDWAIFRCAWLTAFMAAIGCPSLSLIGDTELLSLDSFNLSFGNQE